MKLLLLLGLIQPKKRSDYCDWPTNGTPLRVSKTIIPPGYKSHTVEQDKQYYSPTIEITNGNKNIAEKSSS